MAEKVERRKRTRRKPATVSLDRLQDRVDAIHDRIYNGLGMEIRNEVKEEICAVRNLFIGVLIAVMLALAGVVIEGRVSSGQATSENDRNYKAIIDIGSRLENHIIRTVP